MRKEKPEFLQLWAQQLLREHGFICHQYGLKLDKPIIEVIDISSYWGKWTTGTRTISFSQSLIVDHPWDSVLNVLKHEMAHQLVAEGMAGEPGHGVEFKKACEMLRVPSPFRKAGSTIPTIKSARSDRSISASERVLTKIRKLLALSNSTNEHEALQSLQKAQQLLNKHNISKEIDPGKNSSTCTNLLINLKRKRIESYHRAICSLLLDFFHTEIVIAPLYDAHDLTTYKCIDIMGRSENVKIAGYVYHFLMERLPSLWGKHQAEYHGRKNGRNSYWLGVLNGFREGLKVDQQTEGKVKEIPLRRKSDLLPATTNDQGIGLFVASRYPKLRKSRKRTTRVDMARFEAGTEDGLQLKFRKGLNSGGDKQRLLGH